MPDHQRQNAEVERNASGANAKPAERMAPLVQALGRAGPGDDVLLSMARAAFANGLARNLLNVSVVV